jgi:acyl-CoA thioesterase
VTLTELLEPRRVSDQEFSLDVPDQWQQGRGTFGGVVMGWLVRAIELSEPDPERTIRSLTAEIPAPVMVGPARIRVEPLRRGNAVSTVRATLFSGDEIAAEMVAVLGKSRPGTPTWQHLTPPDRIPWRDLEPAPVAPPIAPTFAQHFEYRVTGPAPFASGDKPEAAGWIRAKNPGPSRGAAMLAAYIDAWWPGAAATFDSPRPVATVTFTMELIGSLEGLNPEAPLYHRAVTPISQDGYTVEFRELWGEDGRLIALNQQTIAIIK